MEIFDDAMEINYEFLKEEEYPIIKFGYSAGFLGTEGVF